MAYRLEYGNTEIRLKYFNLMMVLDQTYCTHKFVNLLSTNSPRTINNVAFFSFFANRNRN